MIDSYAIGIDLGTTYCCVALYRDGKVEIIPNNGENTTPSYVAFRNGNILIGEPARYQAFDNPRNTIYDVKRLIGRRYTEKVVQDDLKLWPFRVIPDDQERPRIAITLNDADIKTFSPEDISGLLLQELKKKAEEHVNSIVTQAVITVPAYFTDAHREATLNAGRLAGLEVLRIINEPTAAALAYGHKNKDTGDKLVLVFDFGGGTLDVTILNIRGDSYTVRSTTGDMHLGGEDFDNRIVQYFVDQINRKYGKDISRDPRIMRRLKAQSEVVKKDLTYEIQASVELESILPNNENFFSALVRARFEALCEDIFVRAIEVVKKALDDADVDKSKIDDIVLAGGSSRIPKMRQMLQTFFNDKQLSYAISADEAVATGAAIQAAILTGSDDPPLRDVVIQDVTSMNLGIEVKTGKMSVVIPRATKLPANVIRTYTTAYDNQDNVCVMIYEGNENMVVNNILIGQFTLEGVRKAKKGELKLKINFKKDINGILKVTASDETTHIKKSLRISRHNCINNNNNDVNFKDL